VIIEIIKGGGFFILKKNLKFYLWSKEDGMKEKDERVLLK
jgi:hypothetical protein